MRHKPNVPVVQWVVLHGFCLQVLSSLWLIDCLFCVIHCSRCPLTIAQVTRYVPYIYLLSNSRKVDFKHVLLNQTLLTRHAQIVDPLSSESSWDVIVQPFYFGSCYEASFLLLLFMFTQGIMNKELFMLSFVQNLYQKYKCTIESVDPLNTYCVCSVWQLRRWAECLLQPKTGQPGAYLVRSTRTWKLSCSERSFLIGRTPLASSRSKVWMLEAR